jgi:hypothetical protein
MGKWMLRGDRDSRGVLGRAVGGGIKLAAIAGAAALLYPPTRQRLMRGLHEKLEALLSRRLGAVVRIGRTTCSPVSGAFELRGLSVQRTPRAEPFLAVSSIRGRVRLRPLLGGDFVLENVEVVAPVVSIVRRAGGTVSNLPPQLEKGPIELMEKAAHAARTAESAARTADRVGLRLHITRASVTDGQMRFRDESLEGYEVVAEGVAGHMEPSADGGGYDFFGALPRIVRRDQPAYLGQVRFYGQLRQGREAGGDLTRFPEAAMWCETEVDGDETIRARVECPRIDSGEVHAHATGEAELAKIAAVVPSGVPALEPLRAPGTHGRVNYDVTITYDPRNGLRVPELRHVARDIAVGGTASAPQGD